MVEVLSPSTEAYDRGEKLEHYKKVSGLEEVVLLAHDARRVGVWRRHRAGWRCTRVDTRGAGLVSVGCELSIAETYLDPLAG